MFKNYSKKAAEETIDAGPKLLILAGGFGTRLKPANLGVPKVLAPVNKIPFLELQIRNWLNQGIRTLIFLLHHEADKIIKFLQELEGGLLLNIRVLILIEPKPLGTGGAIAFALKRMSISNNFYVTNADTWLTSGVKELEVVESPAIAVVRVANCARYGRVKFDSSGRVVVFEEKSNVIRPGWINAGLAKLSPDIFQGILSDVFSLENFIFTKLFLAGKLIAVPIASDFIDIGVPDDYQQFCRWMNKRGSNL